MTNSVLNFLKRDNIIGFESKYIYITNRKELEKMSK